MIKQQIVKNIKKRLLAIPSLWNGKKAIIEMKNHNYPHWKQMEWIGFYFQYLCQRCLSKEMKIPGPKYNRVEFDGFLNIPWDFKAHPINDSQNKIKLEFIVNDRSGIENAIKEYGFVGLILAIGKAEYNDINRNFQCWHKELKGGLSKYEMERINRGAPSRLRKVAFRLEKILLVLIDENILKTSKSFQEGFRNSNGNLRNSKITLNLKDIEPIEIIKFN